MTLHRFLHHLLFKLPRVVLVAYFNVLVNFFGKERCAIIIIVIAVGGGIAWFRENIT